MSVDLGCPGPSKGGGLLWEYVDPDWLFIGHQVLRPRRFQGFVGLISNSHWRKDCKIETQLSGLRGLTWSGVDMVLF